MGPIKFVRGKWRQIRWALAAHRTRNSPLREFAYLDEASVVSLLASRLGPVAEQITESASSTRGSEFSLNDSRTAPGFSLGLGVKATSNETRGRSVVRKASAQSNFRDLIAYEKDRIVTLGAHEPSVPIFSELDRVVRGQLVELTVELDADPSFASSLVLSEVAAMIGDDASEFGVDPLDLVRLRAVHRIVGRLQVGLVPVRAKIVGYHDVDASGVVSGDLFLVGVTNADNYWQDVREVLFSRQTYSVLARISQSGIRDEWSPNRLLRVLAPVAPELSRAIDDMSKFSLEGPASGGGAAASSMDSALRCYVRELAEDFEDTAVQGYEPSATDLAADSLELQRRAFSRADSYLLSIGIGVDPEKAAAVRDQALADAGMSHVLSGGSGKFATPSMLSVGSDNRGGRYIEAQIVAIYW